MFGNRTTRRLTSTFVLISFLLSLMAPVVEAAALIPLKVPGRQVLFDFNSATAAELASIPGIGPKTAAEIVRHRNLFGPFKTIQDVGAVKGVGQARLQKLVSAATQGSRSDLALKGGRPAQPAAEAPAVKPTPKPVVVEAPPVYVVSNNGTKVNINVVDTKALVGNLSRAGFTNEQVNTIANARLISDATGQKLTLKPFSSVSDLRARLASRGAGNLIDGRGTQVVAKPVVTEPAPAPAPKVAPGPNSKGMVYASGDRLLYRFDANGKAVTVNLNQTSATGLYKQLRDLGVPVDTAKAVAQARMKGSFQNLADLTNRVPGMNDLARSPQTKSSVTAPEAPRANPTAAVDAEITNLASRHDAISGRTPTSQVGYERTIKSLQDTYDSMFKAVAKKAAAQNPSVSPEQVAKDPRLQRIAKDIDFYNKGKANLVKTETLNKARVSIDGEISQLSKQAQAVQGRNPTSLQGYDTTIDSLKATYKDLYSRLEMRARLEGGNVSADAIAKDARLAKLSETIDSMRTAKADFQAKKAANVEQARVNAEKAAARKAAAQQQPAAPAETPAPAKSAPQASETAVPAPAAGKAELTAKIDSLSARAKSLFNEIRTESGGTLKTNKEVWDAARHYQGNEGKLAELKKIAGEINSLRANRNQQFPKETQQVAKKVETKAPAPAEVVEPTPAKSKASQQAPAAPEAPAPAPVETVQSRPMTDTKALSAEAKALTAKLVSEGKFANAGEVYRASQKSGLKGDLARLRALNDHIRANRAADAGVPAKAQPVDTNALSAEAKALTAKLVKEGGFANAGEVYRASEQPGAKGELAKLKATNDLIRANRAADGKPVAPEAKAVTNIAGDEVVATGPAASEIGAPKAKFGESFLKMVKGGQYRSTDGGWADGYLKMLKPEGAQLSDALSPKGRGEPLPTNQWADDYVNTLKGEGAAAASETAAPKKTGWLERLFKRGGSQQPTSQQPASEPLASETARPAQPKGDVNASIKDLQGQAYSLKQKLKASGKFANQAEIYRASEAQGASGDLAQLKSINDQIRQLRASKKGASAPTQQPVETQAPTEQVAKSTPKETVAPVEQAPVAKKGGFWQGLKDWFSGKNTLAGKARARAAEQQAAADGPDKVATLPTDGPDGQPAAKPVADGPDGAPAPAKKSGMMDWLLGENSLAGKARRTNQQQAASETAAPVADGPDAKAPAPIADGPDAKAPSLPVDGPDAKAPSLPVDGPDAPAPKPVSRVETINSEIGTLRGKAADISRTLVKEGTFANAAEVYKASEQPGATGKLAELHEVNQNIRSLRGEKAALAKPVADGPDGAPAKTAPSAPEAPVLPVNTAADDGFSVKFGNKVQDLGKMTARQIEAETGGLIKGEAAAKIADTAKANGGKLSVSDIQALNLGDEVVSTLKKGNVDAVTTKLTEARSKAVAQHGADSEIVKKIDSNLEQLKGKEAKPAAASTLGDNHVLTARTQQLESVNAQIAKLEGSNGLLAKFTKGKQLKGLYEQRAKLETEIAGYKQDPVKLEQANAAFQQKNQKVFAEQGRQVGVLEAELAKVDPNSRYGRALQERISQIKGTPIESFAKQTTNMFLIAAGTNILLSLGRQIKNGEKLDIGAAIKSIANPQFLLGTLGSAVGAYAGSKFAVSKLGLIMTTKLGSFLPPVGRTFLMMLPAMAGGAIGGTLLGGGFQNADWVQIAAETIGSTLGTVLAMHFFPGMGLFGQISAGMMGAEAAKFILKMIRGDPKSDAGQDMAQAGNAADPNAGGGDAAAQKASATVGSFTQKDVEDAFNAMSVYYQRYVQSEKEGNYGDAAQYYEKYAALKARVDGMRAASYQARAK